MYSGSMAARVHLPIVVELTLNCPQLSFLSELCVSPNFEDDLGNFFTFHHHYS